MTDTILNLQLSPTIRLRYLLNDECKTSSKFLNSKSFYITISASKGKLTLCCPERANNLLCAGDWPGLSCRLLQLGAHTFFCSAMASCVCKSVAPSWYRHIAVTWSQPRPITTEGSWPSQGPNLTLRDSSDCHDTAGKW